MRKNATPSICPPRVPQKSAIPFADASVDGKADLLGAPRSAAEMLGIAAKWGSGFATAKSRTLAIPSASSGLSMALPSESLRMPEEEFAKHGGTGSVALLAVPPP